MSFVRPEVSALLWRWRDVAGGLVVAAFGAWVFLGVAGWVGWLGLILVLLGLALIWTGSIKARFRSLRDGPGFVEIVERRLTYYAPYGGTSLSLDDVTRIEMEGSGHGPHWLLTVPGEAPARIPVSAEGADQIFETLSRFPGVHYDRAIAASQSTTRERHLIWQKGD